MYFSDLGSIALILALGFALYTVVIAVLGAVRAQPQLVISAKRSLLVVTFFLLLASVALVVSFLTHDFGVNYVAQTSSRAMPWYFTTAAFYGGQQGSLLYWALILSLFSAIFVLTSRRTPVALVPYAIATLMGIETFFLIVLTSVSNPFVRSAASPPDGAGLNPLLMDPGMLIHPPMLLMGYVSFSVPFAFVVAVMITGKLNNEWLRAIRRWMLAAWTIQTTGLILGAWWAYHVLGWGGYWSWDPVECGLAPMVNGHSVLALDDGTGAARNAQSLEFIFAHCHLRTLDLWDLRSTQWCHWFCPFVCLFQYRSLFLDFPGHCNCIFKCTFPVSFA